MSHVDLDVVSIAAILMSNDPHYMEDYNRDNVIAYHLMSANDMLDQRFLMDQWNNAAYRSRFKSEWNTLGEDFEIGF